MNSLMMADVWLDSAEKRLDQLEQQVFGDINKDAEFPKVKEEDQIIDSLAAVQSQLKSTLAKQPKLAQSLAKLNEVDKYLDPAYADSLTLGKAAKAEIILAEEAYIQQQADNFKKLQEMEDVINSAHIKVVPKLQDKFHELNQVNIQQQDETSALTEEIKEVLQKYNTTINLLSKQFIQWDELTTKLEIAAQPKKETD